MNFFSNHFFLVSQDQGEPGAYYGNTGLEEGIIWSMGKFRVANPPPSMFSVENRRKPMQPQDPDNTIHLLCQTGPMSLKDRFLQHGVW